MSFLSPICIVASMMIFHLRDWKLFFKLLAIVNCLMIVPFNGVLLNPSMSGCLGICLAPLFEGWMFYVILAFGFLEGRAQPDGLICILAIMMLFKKNRWILGGLVASYFSWVLLHADSDGRAGAWILSMKFWQTQEDYLWGLGLGSYEVIGPALTKLYPPGVFSVLHSDWLQTLFELGVIGLLGLFSLFCACLWKLRKQPRLFYSLILFGAFGVANMPLHYYLSALYGAFLVRSAFEETRQKILREAYKSLESFLDSSQMPAR